MIFPCIIPLSLGKISQYPSHFTGKDVLPLKKSSYLLGLLLTLTLALTSCAMNMEDSPPAYGEDGFSSYGNDSALMDGVTAWNATELESPVASWDLMVKHGQYHATSKGKVYPYGEVQSSLEEDSAHNYWDETKNTMDGYWDDTKDSAEHFGDELKKATEDMGSDLKKAMDDLAE